MGILNTLSSNQALGDVVSLKTTNPLHLTEGGVKAKDSKTGEISFHEMIMEALNGVNNDQMETSSIMEQMVTNPDEVDAHDVTIAIAKAEMSLGVTKAVIDRAVKAYQEITTLR